MKLSTRPARGGLVELAAKGTVATGVSVVAIGGVWGAQAATTPGRYLAGSSRPAQVELEYAIHVPLVLQGSLPAPPPVPATTTPTPSATDQVPTTATSLASATPTGVTGTPESTATPTDAAAEPSATPSPTEPGGPTPSPTPAVTPTPPLIEWLAHLGGASRTVMRVQDVMLLGLGTEVLVLDVSSEDRPEAMSRLSAFRSDVYALARRNETLFVGDDVGLAVFRMSDPASPELLGRVPVQGGVNHLLLEGGYAIVGGRSGFSVLDISDYEAMGPVADVDTGYVFELVLGAKELYLATADQLVVYDVADLTRPRTIASVAVDPWVNHMAATDDRLYVVNTSLDLLVFDTSDPATLSVVGMFEFDLNPTAVVASGSRAYVALGGGVLVMDVTDPRRPSPLGRADLRGVAGGYGISLVGDRLHIGYSAGGARIFDVADDMNPVAVGGWASFGRVMDLHLDDGVLAVAGDGAHAWLIDVSDPAAPTPVGVAAGEVSSRAVLIRDPHLHSAGYHFRRLGIFDIAEPSAPQIVGSMQGRDLGIAVDLALHDTTLSVATDRDGVVLVDVTAPEAPSVSGAYPIEPRVRAMDIADGIAYVVDESGAVHIVNLSDADAPARLAEIDGPEDPRGLVVDNQRLYVAGVDPMLQIWDVADPTAPMLLGSLPGRDLVFSIAVQGNYAYLGSSGVRVVDVTDPATPTLMGSATGLTDYTSVVVDGDVIYAAGQSGLFVGEVCLPD